MYHQIILVDLSEVQASLNDHISTFSLWIN